MSAHAVAPARYGWIGNRVPISAVSHSGAMTSLGISTIALQRTSERHPQKSPNERPKKSTMAMVSFGTTLPKLRHDRRHEIRDVLECRECIASQCRLGGVPFCMESSGVSHLMRWW